MLIEKDSGRWKRLIVGVVLFMVVTAMVYKNSMLIGAIDSVLQALIGETNHSGSMTQHLMTLISFLGSPKMDILWTLVIAFFLWGFKFKIPALWALCTVFGGDVLGFLVKHIVKRGRPAQHMAKDHGFSYPSGHVLGFFLVAAVLFLVVIPLIKSNSKRVICQLLVVLFIILLAVSRVYLNAHYPSDTIGAMLLGYAWLQIAEALYRSFAPQMTHWRLVHHTYY
ncbi:phosphatase PAP2 family protein [Limosilactobacillus secaliphilus]|uniref:Phosphatase n=1 Tax=Limosilactobacillus secaliphilus TaxID=396268 RepID=A0A0R2HZJ4_9LACO|nr:phosphatase PAP2 family protein [Limosilactobacillus secaliphilus]KRN58291.1 phosphatase [Limosilactobacillus secaliphilus]